MYKRMIFACVAAIIFAAGANAQDLKPVKDKVSKLYGYQDKDKNWVIEPQYEGAKRFKDGLAEVSCKQEKTKYHGVINTQGKVIIPLVCTSVNINYREHLITANRPVEEGGFAWGVYDIEGKEIWPPQFVYSPSFSNGQAIATSSENGLKGVIDTDGQVLIPFENLAMERSFGGFEVLTRDFVRFNYDSRLSRSSEVTYAGYVIPYDPDGDPVRAAAWHVGPIGYRFHRNNLKLAMLEARGRGNGAVLSELNIDWGNDRFVRLEPVEDDKDHSESMVDPLSGKRYTIKAVLCEANGTVVGDLTQWGWLEAEYEEGVIYKAEGVESWMALRDINTPAIASFSIPLTRSRIINHEDVLSGLGLRGYELENMYKPSEFSEKVMEILTGENAGITYRQTPAPPTMRLSRTINEIHRSSLFRHRFRMGEVVNCKTRSSDGGITAEMGNGLICHFEDRFESPSFRMKADEPLYWGPYNDYTILLSLRPGKTGPEYIKDDVHGSNANFEIALELYDSYDQYIQTIATIPSFDYFAEDWLISERAGIALRFRNIREGRDRRDYDRRDYDRRDYDRRDVRDDPRGYNHSGYRDDPRDYNREDLRGSYPDKALIVRAGSEQRIPAAISALENLAKQR